MEKDKDCSVCVFSCILFCFVYQIMKLKVLCFDGKFAWWIDGAFSDFLDGQSLGIMRLQGLTHSTSLLLSKIDWLELLALVQFTQILLGLLVHHDVDAGN